MEVPPTILDLRTIHLVVALTFMIQGSVVALQGRESRAYPGISAFLLSTGALGIGFLLQSFFLWLPRGLSGLSASLLLFWGVALQYVALAQFLGRKPSLVLRLLAIAGTLFLVVLGVVPGPIPFVAVREALAIPFLLGTVGLFHWARFEGFRVGAILSTLSFVGYGVLSVVRVVRGWLDPTQMAPGPNLSNDLDALFFFILGFVWTSGFLLMINQRLQSELRGLATLDPLTNCLNRRALERLVEAEDIRFGRSKRPYSIVLLDLDRFKAINDTRGHATGDLVLVRCAEAVRRGIRTGDSLARWGGEEFLILLPESTVDDGAHLAERLQHQVSQTDFGPDLAVTFSAGVAEVRPGEKGEDVWRRADQALYRAKEHRNRVVTD